MFSEILRLWLNRNKSCHYLTKPIITRIIMYLVFENDIMIEIIVFKDFMTLHMIKFCHYLTKPIIARIIVSLVFKNVIIRTAVLFSEIL